MTETVEKVEKKVAKPKTYKKYTENSSDIDEVFSVIGVPAEYRGNILTRAAVAKKNGIDNYLSTMEQNEKLITLAKEGKLLIP